MTDQIVSRETVRARARAAYARGAARDSHHMNLNAPALVDWLEEFDRCAQFDRCVQAGLVKSPKAPA